MSRRDFGKASFIHIKDSTGRIQVYVRKDKVSQESFAVSISLPLNQYPLAVKRIFGLI